jgi:hypothetical protein
MILGFEVLTAVDMKMAVFWVVAPCSLVEIWVNFYQTTWRYNPEDSHLHERCLCFVVTFVIFCIQNNIWKASREEITWETIV